MVANTKLHRPESPVWLLAFVLGGCSDTASENVTTQGIRAEIRVVADGSGSTAVTAQLTVGSGGIGATQLDLSPGDSLTVTANGFERTMIKDASFLGDIQYTASFAFDDPNTLFVVAMNRNAATDAPNSNVTLPDGFVISMPTSETIYTTDQNIGIVWAPSGTAIVPTVAVTIDCTLMTGQMASGSQHISLSADTGFASTSVVSAMPSGFIDRRRLCEGMVYLDRIRNGNLDRSYGEGGFITGEQYKQKPFFVDPT